MPGPLSYNGFATATAVDSVLVGSNWKRLRLIIASPPGLPDEGLNVGDQQSAVSTATTGVKSSYTVPAGQQGTLDSATFQETTGTTVVANLQVVRAAITYNLGIYTKTGIFTGPFQLLAGDVVQWNVTFAVAASVSDFTISVELDKGEQRIAIGFGSKAVLDQTLTLNVDTLPARLEYEEYGELIQRDIHVITAGPSLAVSYVDVMDW